VRHLARDESSRILPTKVKLVLLIRLALLIQRQAEPNLEVLINALQLQRIDEHLPVVYTVGQIHRWHRVTQQVLEPLLLSNDLHQQRVRALQSDGQVRIVH
jgi:hypothetical protein